MIGTQNKNSEDLNKTAEKSPFQPPFLDVVAPNSGTRYVWPLLLILIAVAMAIARFPLLSNSAQISWIQYKLIMLSLVVGGCGWLLAIIKKSRRKIVGLAFLLLGLILFSFFLATGLDRSRFLPLRGDTLILVVSMITIGMILLIAKKINLFTILGSLMIVSGLIHFFGMFANAAGVPFPISFFIRMNLLFWGGWILYFLGKKPPPARFFVYLLIVFVVMFFLTLILISFIH